MQKFSLTAEISTKVAGGATFFVFTLYIAQVLINNALVLSNLCEYRPK